MDRRLLIVEHDRFQLQAMQEIVEVHFDVVAAPNAEEGLALLTQVDALYAAISDYNMPRMKGDEFLQHVGRMRSNAFRILVSGHAGTVPGFEERVRASCNPDIIFPKPIRQKQFLDALLSLQRVA